MNIKFAANAQRDIARANEWRVKNRPDAATAVVDEIDAALSLLAEQPESAAAFGTWRGRVVRRHYLPETRRQLYYAVVDQAGRHYPHAKVAKSRLSRCLLIERVGFQCCGRTIVASSPDAAEHHSGRAQWVGNKVPCKDWKFL